ncbi:hypothetical protein BGW36DRAFT_378966 [Talaromyces proteolyticus]|uniref:F-box domain-containing protein n=1 Tax=Talaromyces proteolyticus TaxID=1131652 RepID=A0AAD4KSW4_9EURO|nr:uncharacterized protein BGW36DRAFT_378966 [Talaromyces proteolyticus]KAH8697587.1 hypothetical protein BGW36DRAFT_378966 [Talaromyces proteolyticus]
MSQYYLIAQNGLLTLHKPERAPLILYSAEDHKWAYTDIDEIQVEELIEEPASPCRLQNLTTIRHVPQNRKWTPSHPPLIQYKLGNENGILILRKRKYMHQHISSRREDNESTFHDEQITKSFNSKGSFLVLPPELRILIYRHLLVCYPNAVPHPICSCTSSFRIIIRKDIYSGYRLYPQILVTCRQIYLEASPILYRENVFNQEYFWPSTLRDHRLYPVPLSDTCRLGEKAQLISRIRIIRQYRNILLGNGQLKIFRSFPSLAEVKVDFDLNDPVSELDLTTLWREVMKSLNRRQPKLKRVESCIRLPFDDDYREWGKNQKSTSLDFSLHKRKKRDIEKWMKEEQLFVGRHLSWSFETLTSEYCGPSCEITLVVDDIENADQASRIPVKVVSEYEERFGYEII